MTTTTTAELIEGLRGRLISAEHADYDIARAVWNGAIDRRPRLIARCIGTADVVAAVRFARDHDLEIAIRGGGHNVAGTAVCDDGVVIDLSAMRGVRPMAVGFIRLPDFSCIGQHCACWSFATTGLSPGNLAFYPWIAPGKSFSPARIGTLMRFSNGVRGQLQFGL